MGLLPRSTFPAQPRQLPSCVLERSLSFERLCGGLEQVPLLGSAELGPIPVEQGAMQ